MAGTVSIGRLRFDPERLVLYDGSEVVPLAPLPAQMLAELVRAGGSVVATASMRKALWGDAAVEDRNLNQQMYVLRRVLRRDPRIIIENVPRRGYRLVVLPQAAEPATRLRRWRFALGGVAALIVVLGFWYAHHRAVAAAFDRDLAVANYLATSEGPNHLNRAADAYRALMAAYPQNAAAYGGLALVDAKRALNVGGAQRARFFEMARSEAHMAVQHDPHESNALTALGIVASVRDNRVDVARRMFDAAVNADPTGESPRAWRGKFLLSVGQFDDAGRDFQTMSQAIPTSGYAVGSFGEWLILDGDYAKASAVLSQAVDLGNHPGFTRYWLARAYHLEGLDAQALRVANELVGLYPDEPSAIALRIGIEKKLGQVREAFTDLHHLQENPDAVHIDPLAVASAEVAVGNRTAAAQILRQYVLSGSHNIDDVARLRTDPQLHALCRDRGINVAMTL